MRFRPWRISATKSSTAAPVSDATVPGLGHRRPTRDEANDKAQAIIRRLTAARARAEGMCKQPLVLGKMCR